MLIAAATVCSSCRQTAWLVVENRSSGPLEVASEPSSSRTPQFDMHTEWLAPGAAMKVRAASSKTTGIVVPIISGIWMESGQSHMLILGTSRDWFVVPAEKWTGASQWMNRDFYGRMMRNRLGTITIFDKPQHCALRTADGQWIALKRSSR
jgi:hypothetical protein